MLDWIPGSTRDQNVLLNIQKKKQYPVVPQELIACQRCKKNGSWESFSSSSTASWSPEFSSSKVGQGHNSERVELNFIDYRTSSGSVLEVGISELSRFCRNLNSYVSSSSRYHVCQLPSLHPIKIPLALPMPSVHEWVYRAASLLQKNHSKKKDVGFRVNIGKFTWRFLKPSPYKTFKNLSIHNIFSAYAAPCPFSSRANLNTRKTRTIRKARMRFIDLRGMCWLCWFHDIDSRQADTHVHSYNNRCLYMQAFEKIYKCSTYIYIIYIYTQINTTFFYVKSMPKTRFLQPKAQGGRRGMSHYWGIDDMV